MWFVTRTHRKTPATSLVWGLVLSLCASVNANAAGQFGDLDLLQNPGRVYSQLSAKPATDLSVEDRVMLARLVVMTFNLEHLDQVNALLNDPVTTGNNTATAMKFFIAGIIKEQRLIDYSGAQASYDQALASFEWGTNPRLALTIMKSKSYKFAVSEHFGEALQVLRQMQHLEKTEGSDSFAAAYINEALAELYGYTSEYALSIKHYRTALESYEQLRYPARILDTELGLATSYRYAGQYARALEHIARYLELRAKELPMVNQFYGNYTKAMILAESGACNEALLAIDHALGLKGPDDYNGELLKRRAECLLTQGDVAAAEQAINSAMAAMFSRAAYKDTLSAAEAHRILADIRARQGRYPEAYRLLTQFIKTKEISNQNRFDTTLSSMLKQSSTDQRDLDIARLKQTSAEQALSVEMSRNARLRTYWLAVMGIVSTLALLILAFLQHRRRLQLEATRKELASARDQANAGNKAKSQFLAHMSHEIRTPLNAIMGLTTLLLRTDLNSKQLYLSNRINVASTSLLQLVNDILDLSKIESGKLTIEHIETQLNDVIEQVKDMMGVPAQNKGLEFMVDITTELPARINTDPLRIKQVLLNLLSNAITFTDSGSVILRIRQIEKTDRTARLRFSVIDTGCGIPKDKHSALFVAFAQADQSITRRYGGTGLGLTISRQLVEMMDGRLWFNSQEGEGSTFSFELPFPVVEWDAPLFTEYNSHLGNARILVVDDNPLARTVLQDDIKQLGARVESVASAKDAYARLTHQDTVDPFTLVLIDFRMPDTDGINACQHITEALHLENPPKLVLISAVGTSILRSEAKALEGISGFIAKPFTPVEMAKVLAQACGGIESGEERSWGGLQLMEDAPYRPLAGIRALLVEDNAINREIANEFLTEAGALVTFADHGAEALERLRAATFDVVLMDIQMPVMDGYEATVHIRKNPDWDNLPVIAMTANVLKEDRARALETGMNDHIGKPIDAEIMINTIKRWVNQVRTSANGVPPYQPQAPQSTITSEKAPTSIHSSAHSTAGLAYAEAPVFDLEIARKNANNNDTLMLKILRDFRNSHANDAHNIEQAIEAGLGEAAHRISHNLKSTAGSIGAKQLQAIATQLDNAVRVDTLDLGGYLLPDLTQALERVVAALTDYLAEHAPSNLDSAETPSIDITAQIAKVRQLLEEMDPAACDAVSVLASALPQTLYVIAQALQEQAKAFDFQSALASLEDIEQGLE